MYTYFFKKFGNFRKKIKGTDSFWFQTKIENLDVYVMWNNFVDNDIFFMLWTFKHSYNLFPSHFDGKYMNLWEKTTKYG